jgi:parallel beta-helix repeat protein
MKSLLLLLFIIPCYTANAKKYYISNVSGNDANTGTTPATAWKTITRLNSFTGLLPGDAILFNRGQTFYGSIMVNSSGSPGNPILFGAYGTGASPVITGFIKVSEWTNHGNNIWESSNSISSLPYINMVVINGVNTAMGRFPNTGYFMYQSHSGHDHITSSNLAGPANWTDAELAMNITTGRIVRNPIIGQSGETLTYTPDPEGAGFQSDNQQFIIQNDIRTLDTANEWYYNPSTKKISIYSIGTPEGVNVATLDSLVYINGLRYITFDNISFQGANTASIQLKRSQNISIQNCNFNFSGRNAVFGAKGGSSLNVIIQNCTLNHINDNGIDLPRVDFDNATIRLNTVKNCGVVYGMIDRNDGINNNSTAQAISASGANCVIENNTIDSVGYIGIHFFGSNTTIQNNYIMDYCLLFNDGGGIYSWNGDGRTIQSGIKILNNIILNRNTLSSVNTGDYGVYLDDLSNNIEVRGNTCANSGWGIELHNVFDIKVSNNTAYNNSMASIVLISDKRAGFVTGRTNMDNIEIENNIFFAKTATQKTFWIYAKILPVSPPHLKSDSNYYVSPVDGKGTSILINYNNQNVTNRTLQMWQTYSGQDARSKVAPKNIVDADSKFVYNPGSSPLAISLDADYIDVKNNSYHGKIVLAPFTSAVLIKSGMIIK